MPLLKVEVDGREIEVPHGATVMEAANRLGIYVPHFCYHKKLSIAANCRMCLVQIEKAPKPAPACATPVTDGMKVWTHSEAAKKAQSGVMEFLLINHPLDCPICDQGGECQLQDLAVGYGGGESRYAEPKRIVFHKNLGPLVSAEEMSRCIHCTRCVRFGQEVAGVMELGMIGRGEHSEIVSFVGSTVDSELSGNMIDICPVGALTSKPFRYSARTWELVRRRTVSPHDSLGANMVAQVKQDRVLRMVPLENEAVNECWLSDKDRFAYEGLNSPQRLLSPMIRDGDQWREVDWQTALDRVVDGVLSVRAAAGAPSIGALIHPMSTLEEMHLAQKLVRGLGSGNIDFRLRQSDFRMDGHRQGVPWLGMHVSEISSLDRALVIGSFLRKDHPLIAARLRMASRRSLRLNIVHSVDDDLLMNVDNKAIVRPSELLEVVAQIVKAAAELKGLSVSELAGVAPAQQAAVDMAKSLCSGKSVGIFLGTFAEQHPRAAEIHALVQELARIVGARFGYLGQAGNSVGGYLANCLPGRESHGAKAMLESPRRAYILFGVEPELDCADPVIAMQALDGAEFVVAVTGYDGRVRDYADVMLPLAPFTETSGTFVNCEGRAQAFNSVVKGAGQSRPGWKILRVLGNLLDLPGFDQNSSEAVRDELGATESWLSRLNNQVDGLGFSGGRDKSVAIERIADVPIYASDPIVRHADSLQRTRDARAPRAHVCSRTAAELGVSDGAIVRIRQAGMVELPVVLDDRVPEGAVRVSASHPHTAALGSQFGNLTLERV